MKKKFFRIIYSVLILTTIVEMLSVSSCAANPQPDLPQGSNIKTASVILKGKEFDVEINPATLSVLVKNKAGRQAYASEELDAAVVSNLRSDDSSASWEFAAKGITCTMVLRDDYLDVNISSKSAGQFTWPVINKGAVGYTLPWGQGKYIPANDARWIEFWNYLGPFSGAQDLSMQFIGVNHKDFALVYVIKNMFNNEISLEGTTFLKMKFFHEFTSTVKEKNYGFRLYMTANDPVAIATTYRNYIVEQKRMVTLEEKAKDNPNIRKLYGAPFIYLWGSQFVVKENIKNWSDFGTYLASGFNAAGPDLSKHIRDLIKDKSVAAEFPKSIKDIKASGAANQYVRNVVVEALNGAMTSPDLYDKRFWKDSDLTDKAKAYIQKGVQQLTQLELYDLNKELFYTAYQPYLQPVSEWGNGTSSFVLNKLQEDGIYKAWLGLESSQQAFAHPEFLAKADSMGYLTALYDSYHSIHQPGKEMWETAKFDDTTLYYTSNILNKDGSVNKGFQGVGRKLNPTLSMPAVQQRMNKLMSNHFSFNSWFIDCDATGEIFDDYTKSRMTSQAEDASARLQRMAWIRDAKHLVIGSEGGNDFAASTIAYAHGLCSPVLVWKDKDWRVNKESVYYFGPYFAPDGGVPIHFKKQVPLKPLYHYVYFDPKFSLPLFQLVYNNSVIPSHHWSMGSLKLIDEVINNKLKEILYNYPPMYNLDRNELLKHEKTISSHVKVFSKTHPIAVKQPMTGFEYLTEDKLVQRTRFGNDLEVIANFGDKPYGTKDTIPGRSLLIIDHTDNGKKTIYTPVQ